MKRKIILMICLILSCSLLFIGCTIKEDSEESRGLCETMLNYIIQDDYTAAYGMVSHVASEEDFAYLWNVMRDVLKNSQTYEMQQKNWYQNWNNGVTTTQVLFEVVTDDGKVCQFTIYTMDQVEGIAGIHFIDSTEFVQKTESLQLVNICLSILSLLCFAFSIWMLIDCLKRRLKHKIWWAIVTLCYLGIGLTMSDSVFDFRFRISLFAGISSLSSDRTALAVALTVFLPIGAIVYFFMRKRLTLSEKPQVQEASEQEKEETKS